MKLNTQNRRTGAYTASHLRNIRSHLAGLQGYDVMALELIQNADDAKAEAITFDITDHGLVVRNSGQFTYCGDLLARPCGLIATSNCSCDYHRIADDRLPLEGSPYRVIAPSLERPEAES